MTRNYIDLGRHLCWLPRRGGLALGLLVVGLCGLLVGQSQAAQADTVLWQLGQADDSCAEFCDVQKGAPEAVNVPGDWQTRTAWKLVPKGLAGSSTPALALRYELAAVPAQGVMFSFKLLHAPKSGAQMAVFSNGQMAGLIQLWGTFDTGSPYRWKKTYRLYVPAEMLAAGANVLRLEAVRPLWSDASVDSKVWWEWDFLKLEALGAAAREPLHGSLVYLGTVMKQNEGFNIDDKTLAMTPSVLRWLGIAYSGNTMRADFWYDVGGLQPRRLEYLQLLRDLNMTVMADYVSGHFHNTREGHMPANVRTDIENFFKRYGGLLQYYELGNEPCMFGGGFAEYLETARVLNQLKPAHVKVVAPGWAFGGGKGTPLNWDASVVNRRRIEALCQAINGHSYGYSYGDYRGGSFVENLASVQGVEDGWDVEYLNSETGTGNWHSEENGPRFASSQPHAQAFDRILRAHIAVVEHTMQHALMFGEFSLLQIPKTWNDPNVLTAYNAAKGEDTRLKTYRRLALTYATHGAPLPWTCLNRQALADHKVYFRAVDTAALPAQLGSGATADKLLLNFVNFETTPQTMSVRVTLPQKGVYPAERFGPGDTYAAAHSTLNLEASPSVDLTVSLPAGESVQYILTPPQARAPYPPVGLEALPEQAGATLRWRACSGASEYEVQQASSENGPFKTVASHLQATSYTASGLKNGQSYWFLIVAGNAQGCSAPSAAVSAVAGVPLPPLDCKAMPGNQQVTLHWTAADRASYYRVQRATSRTSPFVCVADQLTGTNFCDRSLTNGARYYYTVIAANDCGASVPSARVQASPEAPLAAPSGLSATAGDARVVLHWPANPEAAGYTIKRATAPGGSYVTIVSDFVGSDYKDDDVANGQTYKYQLSFRKLGPESAPSPELGALPQATPLPEPWKSADIGQVGRHGTATYNPSTQVFTVQGAGHDMWGASDAAHFVYVPLQADGALTVHVTGFDSTDQHCKMGVMIRETLEPGAARALLHLAPTYCGFTFRKVANGPCDMEGDSPHSWLKIVRQDGTVTGSLSNDGKKWTQRGKVQLAANKQVLIGLTVCSHNNGVLNKVLFDHVVLDAPASAAQKP